MEENLADKSSTEKEASPFFEGFRHPFILTGLIYLGPICFLVVLIFCRKLYCYPDLVDLTVILNVMTFVLDIYVLVQVRHLPHNSYLYLRYSAFFLLLFSLFCFFKIHLFYDESSFFRDSALEITNFFLQIFFYFLIGILLARALAGFCIKSPNSNFEKRAFSSELMWYLLPLFMAMVISDRELIENFRLKSFLAFTAMFPAGLGIFPAFLKLESITIFNTTILRFNLISTSIIGWIAYVLLILLGLIFRKRFIWYIFVILLLLNIIGCRIVIISLHHSDF